MQLSHCRWNAFFGVAPHVTPSGGGPDRGGGTPRPGRLREVQSQLANHAISRMRCSEATVGQLTGPVSVLAISRKTIGGGRDQNHFLPRQQQLRDHTRGRGHERTHPRSFNVPRRRLIRAVAALRAGTGRTTAGSRPVRLEPVLMRETVMLASSLAGTSPAVDRET